ncbi:MAG: recombination-associated protein RdgC [Pseudomonadota bacterium]
MFKNALIFRIVHWEQPTLPEIEERLAGLRFVECGATQPESAGWIEPRGERHGALAESVGGELMLRLATETKAVPTSVVKQRLEEALDKIEADTGRRPKGKKAKELKEAIVHELLPRAFPKRGSTWVWIAPQAGLVVVDAASLKKADKATTLLVELLGGKLQLALLQTELSPASAMAQWLTEREAPAGFTLDRDCELKQPDSEKATVRYARHTLDIDELGEHIRQGKLPTQLALTWNDRVSFVLTESMALKKLKLLDVVLESHERSRDDAGFDTDVALITGELRHLIADLVQALGGELKRDPAPATATAPAAAPATEPELAAPWV